MTDLIGKPLSPDSGFLLFGPGRKFLIFLSKGLDHSIGGGSLWMEAWDGVLARGSLHTKRRRERFYK